ncbi:hypothetical protein E1264_11650 [Actinomadura sp. KC216]|uniref:hypothetical protein n=1 Tax=Actinomadura sp. KC216 TaxID=2530370 RepID=UPI00104C5ED0|nr:hypothetical protein [Actinomadura sp. KC216]TDB88332.1 hypothetical protein E1264_11650 [Actinomadura sp. KC216]
MSAEKSPCPGRCNARYRKAVRDFDEATRAYETAMGSWVNARQQVLDVEAATGADDGTRNILRGLDELRPQPPAPVTIVPTDGAPVWCDRDQAAIRRALVEIDDLAALLASWSDGHRGAGSGERTSGHRPGSASPSPIADTLDELYRALATVETEWREARGLPPRPHRGAVEARTRTIGWLLGQLDQILHHPGSVAFGRATLAWQRRLQQATRSDPVVRRRPAVPCPRCDRRALRTRDDGYTQCAGCGRLLDEREYDELAELAEIKLAVEGPKDSDEHSAPARGR